MSLTINGREVPVQGVRELKPGMTIQEASQKTKNNGLDEVYFSSEGKSYIAYGDSLNIGTLHSNKIPSASYNGHQADVIAFEDEINSVWEGIGKGARTALKDTSESVIGAVKNIIATVGPGVAVGGGAAIAGYSIYQLLKNSEQAALVAGATSGIGQGVLDALKSGAIGALKIIAVAGAVGAGVTVTYGAIKGAMDARNTVADYTTIASVIKDGTTPAGGGDPNAQFNYQYLPPIDQSNPYFTYQSPPPQPAYTPVPQGNPLPMGTIGQLVSPQSLFQR